MTDRLTDIRRLLLQAQVRLLNENDPELRELAVDLSLLLAKIQKRRAQLETINA